MSKQVNIRLEEQTYLNVKTTAELLGITVSELLRISYWTLRDVLDCGDEYNDKISLLKKAVEFNLTR